MLKITENDQQIFVKVLSLPYDNSPFTFPVKTTQNRWHLLQVSNVRDILTLTLVHYVTLFPCLVI